MPLTNLIPPSIISAAGQVTKWPNGVRRSEMVEHAQDLTVNQECDEAEAKVVALFTRREERANVFGVLSEVRELCPVHHSKSIDQWMVTDYDDVKRTLMERV